MWNVITSFASPPSFSICGQIALNASAECKTCGASWTLVKRHDKTPSFFFLPTGHMQYMPDTESLPQLDLNLPEAAQKRPATYFFLKQNPLKMDLRLLSMKSDLGWPDVSCSVWRHISHCHCGPLWLALWFYLGINNCCRQAAVIAAWWSACVEEVGDVEWPLGCAGTKLREWLKNTMCTPTELVIGTQTVKTSRPALKYEGATSEMSAAKKEFSRGDLFHNTTRLKGQVRF